MNNRNSHGPKRRMGAFSVAVAVALLALQIAACGGDKPEELVKLGQSDLERKDGVSAVLRFKSALQQRDDVATRVLLGRALLLKGEPTAAEAEFRRVLEANASKDEVVPLLVQSILAQGHYRKVVDSMATFQLGTPAAVAEYKTLLASAYASVPNLPKAEQAIEEALAAVPNRPDSLLVHARLKINRGDAQGAIGLLDAMLARQERSAEAWHLKGVALLQTEGRDAEARAAFEKSIELDGKYAPAHGAILAQALRRGDMRAAKDQLAKMNEVAPSHIETRFQNAQMALLDKDLVKAREGIQQLLRVAPEVPALLSVAAAIEWQGGSLVIARKHLEAALRIEPARDDLRANLARIALTLGQPQQALTILAPALDAGQPKASVLGVAGEAALQLGRAAEAESYFAKAVKAAPDDSRTQSALAMAQIASGNPMAGLSKLESLAAQGKDGLADAQLASARLARREFDAALAAADSLVKKQPDSASAVMVRARVLAAKGDRAGFRQALERALQVEPRHLQALISLAELDLTEVKLDAVKARAQEVFKSDAGNAAAVSAMSELALRAGMPSEQVVAALKEAIRLNPEEPTAHVRLVNHLIASRQLKQAVAVAQDASAALPNDGQVVDALARALLADGNTQQALVTFRRLLTIAPDSARAHARIAELHRVEGNKSARMASLRRAVEIDPMMRDVRELWVAAMLEDGRSKELLEVAADMQRKAGKAAGGYLLESYALQMQRQHGAAAAAASRGLQRAGDVPELALHLFVALLADNRWKQAESFGLEWLQRHPADGAIAYNLGEGYMMQRDFASAERYFERAVTLRPDHVPSLNNLASMRNLQNKPGGVEPAKRALALAPESPQLLDTLAFAYATEKKMTEALDTQRKAVALAPNSAALGLNLGKLALMAGDKELARKEWTRVGTLPTDPSARSEAARLLQAL